MKKENLEKIRLGVNELTRYLSKEEIQKISISKKIGSIKKN